MFVCAGLAHIFIVNLRTYHTVRFHFFNIPVTTIDVCDEFLVMGDVVGHVRVVNFRDIVGYEFYEYILNDIIRERGQTLKID